MAKHFPQVRSWKTGFALCICGSSALVIKGTVPSRNLNLYESMTSSGIPKNQLEKGYKRYRKVGLFDARRQHISERLAGGRCLYNHEECFGIPASEAFGIPISCPLTIWWLRTRFLSSVKEHERSIFACWMVQNSHGSSKDTAIAFCSFCSTGPSCHCWGFWEEHSHVSTSGLKSNDQIGQWSQRSNVQRYSEMIN